MNDLNGNPLMFIQTIKENVNNYSNQIYFDSRNKVKKEKILPIKEDVKVVSKELLDKLNLITSAQKKGMKIVCEVILSTQEVVVGEIEFGDSNCISCNGLNIRLDNILELNIKTLKSV